jgi:hypothetical protein
VNDHDIDDLFKHAADSSHDLRPELLRQLEDTIRPSLGPVRPLPPAWSMTIGAFLICAAISLAGAARAGFFGIAKMDSIERVLIFSLLAVLAWAAAHLFVREMIPGSLHLLSSRSLLIMGSLALLGLFALLFRNYHTHHFVSIGLVCLVTGLLHAIPAGLLSWLLLRRGFAVNPISAGLAAGTLAGLAGLGMLELHCPNFETAHILVWHIAVVPFSAAAGALLAWRLRFRSHSGQPSDDQ